MFLAGVAVEPANYEIFVVIIAAKMISSLTYMSEAGIQPIALGRGPNGTIRYRWSDVKAWLESLEYVS